jgi:cell division protein ZapA
MVSVGWKGAGSMPQEQERIQVEILGEIFTVKGEANREEIIRTSNYLNEQLSVLKSRHPNMNAKNLAILGAFNLADEFLRIRKDYEALVSILDRQ